MHEPTYKDFLLIEATYGDTMENSISRWIKLRELLDFDFAAKFNDDVVIVHKRFTAETLLKAFHVAAGIGV